MEEKLWAGRFEKEQASAFNDINYSINEDIFLIKHDILASKAHARGLSKIGIFNEEELCKVLKALEDIAYEVKNSKVKPNASDEDVHMYLERLLTEKVGELGKRIHTARSRNDQTVTALKLWMKDACYEHLQGIKTLALTLKEIATENKEVLLSGSTHLQAAQPISLAFYFMNYAQKLKRDYHKIQEMIKTMDESPLGSGALAGVNYEIDRNFVAKEMGFKGIAENAMDAVSDRDFVCDYLYVISLCTAHLSQLAEDMIIWNSPMFSYITLSDEYSSGSSIMPQKKNPDGFELIRGKAAIASARLNAMLGTIKGLAMSYNKDLQADKKLVHEAYEDFSKVLRILPNMLATMKFNKKAMLNGLELGYVNATDLADALVERGLAFREAHHLVGELVKIANEQGKALEKLEISEFKAANELFDEWVYEVLDYMFSISRKKTEGSTNPAMLEKQINNYKI